MTNRRATPSHIIPATPPVVNSHSHHGGPAATQDHSWSSRVSISPSSKPFGSKYLRVQTLSFGPNPTNRSYSAGIRLTTFPFASEITSYHSRYVKVRPNR